MQFSTAFIVAALPFLGLASAAAVDAPVASTLNERSGKISIAINKRSRLVKDNGVVNGDALRAHVAHASAKIQKGLNAFERNTGSRHALASSQIGTTKRAVGSDPLTDGSEELWYGAISVGTPAVKYTGMYHFFLLIRICSYVHDSRL
jgi:cathepsin D